MLDVMVGVVATAGVIISLLFVGWQTRELSKQTRINNAISITSAYGSCAELMNNVHGPILANPDLRAYFYDGKLCDADNKDRQLVLTVAELFADTAEYALMTAKHVRDASPFTCYPSDLLQSSPSLRDAVTAHPAWWPELASMQSNPRWPS